MNKLISLVLSLITIFSLVNLNYIVSYNFLTLLIFIILYMFYKNINLKDYRKKEIILSIIYSIILSLNYIVGQNILNYMNNNSIDIINYIVSFKSIIIFIGLFPLILSIILKIISLSYKINIFNNNFKSNKKLFIISFVIMLLCWLPYLLVFFPGILSSDVTSQYSMFVNGFNNLSNHHPILHTMFLYLPYKIGISIFGNANMAVALTSFIQMIIMSLSFSYLICFINKNNINKYVTFIIILYYSIIPLFGLYSITLWKDILFSIIFMLFSLNIYKLFIKDKLDLLDLIILFIIGLLSTLLRNNAIYIMLFILPFILLFKNNKFKIFITICLVILFNYIITGPIFNMLDIKKSSSAEYISIPL